MSDQLETFRDDSYYHMWRLRRKNERKWDDGFHINTKAEAEALCELLNKLEYKIENQAERIKYLEGATNHATGTPLSKMQEQRDRLAEVLKNIRADYCGMETTEECECEDCVFLRPIDEALTAVKGGKP